MKQHNKYAMWRTLSYSMRPSTFQHSSPAGRQREIAGVLQLQPLGVHLDLDGGATGKHAVTGVAELLHGGSLCGVTGQQLHEGGLEDAQLAPGGSGHARPLPW